MPNNHMNMHHNKPSAKKILILMEVSHPDGRRGFDSRLDNRLGRCGVTNYVEEASGSVKLSGGCTYGMSHVVRTAEAGTQNYLQRRMLVDLIMCDP
eukprot:13654648-Ditylum_brightwellii.AAC.1